MADTYTPPPVWTHDAENGGKFAAVNRPTAGAREERDLPVGIHPLQLYSLATPNGVKNSILEWLRMNEKAGLITLVTDLADRVQVEIDPNDDSRLNFEVPEDVIGIFAVGAGNIIQIG